MKNISIILSIFFVIWSHSSFPAHVDPEKALIAATNFYIGYHPETNSKTEPKVSFIYTESHPVTNEAIFYAVNFSDTGFVLIAAEDGVSPVLGYSYTSFYTGQDLPVQLTGLVEEYRNLISHVQLNESALSLHKAGEWNLLLSPLAEKGTRALADPLLYCKWDQGARYNGLCPEDPAGPGGRVYAGCVATAMSMVMYHFRYPNSGQGIRGYWSDYGYLEVDFSQSVYNWNEMPTSLTISNYPVAKLMYDAGVAVDMMYSPNGSGAYMDDAADAMWMYFKYNPNLSLEYRNSYSFTQWVDLLKNQIDQGYPLIYAGYGSNGPGHAFVCDGYDSGNLFHFNWGWSGSYNGYYVMDYLTPGGYNFSSWQMAVINCFPALLAYPNGCQGNTVITGRTGSFTEGSGNSNYTNLSNCSWLIRPETAVSSIFLKFHAFDTEPGFDKVCVYDGTDVNAPLIGCYSGNTIPSDITSSGGSLYITFETNGTTTAKGFFAEYFANLTRFCESFTTLTDPSGTIEDGSGTYPYHANTFCRWWIKPDNAGTIVIDFEEFDLEDGRDFLILMNPQTYPSSEIIRFTGSQLPSSYVHTGSSLIVRFISDDFNQNSGWKLNYTSWPVSVDGHQAAAILVHPNPFSEQLMISGITGQSDISLYDITGRRIYSGQSGEMNEVFLLSTQQYPSGIYFLHIINQSGRMIYKVVKP
jgi:hypothetical protein